MTIQDTIEDSQGCALWYDDDAVNAVYLEVVSDAHFATIFLEGGGHLRREIPKHTTQLMDFCLNAGPIELEFKTSRLLSIDTRDEGQITTLAVNPARISAMRELNCIKDTDIRRVAIYFRDGTYQEFIVTDPRGSIARVQEARRRASADDHGKRSHPKREPFDF